MRVRFELQDCHRHILASADISTSIGDVQAIKGALRAVGSWYTKCRWIGYTIWDDFHADSVERGAMYIPPCHEDS